MLITLLSAAALLLGTAAGFGIYVRTLDTVYPNVSVDGVELGGLTVEQAAEKLENRGFADASGESITVHLPFECSFTVSAAQAGVHASPELAAQAAYDYGRDGFFSSMFQYLKCCFKAQRLAYGGEEELDETYIRAEIADAVLALNEAAMGSGIEVGEESITVVKGARSVSVNADEVCSLITAALQSGDYGDISYQPQVTGNTELNLQELHDMVYREPVDAEYDPESYTATAHVTGVDFDMEAAQALWDAAAAGATVTIPLIRTEPAVTTEYLNSRLFADVLSQKTTGLTYEYNRNNNVTKAAEAMNGVVLNPGETFSYNETLGQRTTAAGYLGAGAYLGGKVVTEVGGGICQGSSTLYYCTLYANLEIVERTCHWFGVSYLPSGLDATVSWGGPDFVFKNNRDYPIRIEAYTDLNGSPTLTVKILGTDVDGSYVQITTDVWATADAYGATSYRWVYAADGTLISKKTEATSTYHYHTEEEESPSPSPSPGESPLPSESPTPSGSPLPSESPTPSGSPLPSESPASSESPLPSGSPIPSDTPAPSDAPVEPTAPVEG